jgi:MHS family shikimate/dehydroshikimate transporter-like MFS transporter
MSAEFAGGLAPFIATALLAWAGEYRTVALYVMAAGLISFVSVYLATEPFREDLTEELTREPGATASGAGQTTWRAYEPDLQRRIDNENRGGRQRTRSC